MQIGISTIGFIPAVILIAIGLAGVQAAAQPFIGNIFNSSFAKEQLPKTTRKSLTEYLADQYTETKMRIRVNKRGERVVEDLAMTIQYIYNVNYWMVNLGSLGSIATTLMEKYIGYWSAYLLDVCAVVLCVIIIQLARPKFVHPPVHGAVLPRTARCSWYAVQSRFDLDAALPESQLRTHNRVVPWDKEFINELRDALSAFKICVGWPIFWVCMGEGAQVSISQAGQMETHGVPNDLIKSSNPIAYMIIGVMIRFSPINRISLGFAIMSVAMAYAAVVQALIYKAGPCYTYPLACVASQGGKIPNYVHVLVQLPVYIIIALAEVFCWPTGSEYTYSHSPDSMKSILQACYTGTAGLGYLLRMALTPLTKDPLLIVLWSVVAGMMFITTCWFRIAFQHY
ncbi:oligopeptide transporter [Arthroderma uncinatum]|uniref:oligopeptide transporter n=1 Tax=Arthroderma uncinatum TaxID=74035 RepID=UPI00144A54E6|nr:oligopeptide transporter [Arthroderma uncinatum]KAF3484344.1 oligopeptide transporter [Arthroderma uncinatum]